MFDWLWRERREGEKGFGAHSRRAWLQGNEWKDGMGGASTGSAPYRMRSIWFNTVEDSML